MRIDALEIEHIGLPYNELAITSDAFGSLGHMDDDWHSYAAELLPEKLVYNNVTFRLGEADKWNALCCRRDTLGLSQGTSKVAMLVASSNGDRDVEFDAGVKSCQKGPLLLWILW